MFHWKSPPFWICIAVLVPHLANSMLFGDDLSVKLGIGGNTREGAWVEAQIDGLSPEAQQIEIATLDGDGIGVQYQADANRSGTSTCYFQMPKGTSSITFSSHDAAGTLLDSDVIQAPTTIPLERKWIVVIGRDSVVSKRKVRSSRLPKVTQVENADDLPFQSVAYNGVDLVILVGSSADGLNQISEAQKRALAQWVKKGGRILITLGGLASRATTEDGWINQFLDVSVSQEVLDIDPRILESYTNAQSPLDPFQGLRLPSDQGRTLLPGRTEDRRSTPLVQEHLVGLGRVMLIAADLDQEPFASTWPYRQDLISRLLPDTFGRGDRSQQRISRDAGYSDIAGQVRRSIDQFDNHWRVPFKWIAGFTVLYLLVIGPLDYWIVNRLIGRPLVGWLTSGIFVALFCGLAIVGSQASIPSSSTVNEFTITDIDLDSKTGRGFAWSQYLNSQPCKVDLSYLPTDLLGSANGSGIAGWWGMGGDAFGGLASTGRDHQLPAYRIQQQHTEGTLTSNIRQLPLPTAATKGLACRWEFTTDMEQQSDLVEQRGTDLLRGTFKNPLPVDLHNGVLLYRDWAYLLPTRFTVGSTSMDVSRLTYKSLKLRLTRRKLRDVNASEPWNREMDDDLQRIIELVMFYETAGGVSYTELNNRILGDLDLSYILQTDRAILMGQLSEPVVELTHEDSESQFSRGVSNNFVRILFPVEKYSDKRTRRD